MHLLTYLFVMSSWKWDLLTRIMCSWSLQKLHGPKSHNQIRGIIIRHVVLHRAMPCLRGLSDEFHSFIIWKLCGQTCVLSRQSITFCLICATVLVFSTHYTVCLIIFASSTSCQCYIIAGNPVGGSYPVGVMWNWVSQYVIPVTHCNYLW